MTSLVSIITPCTIDREHFLPDLQAMINAQTYKNLEWIIVDGSGTIGHKRNLGCNQSKGEIILHMDSDDKFKPLWVEQSVNWLLSSGADITGLRQAYFASKEHKWVYTHPNERGYVIEGSMCYWKSYWQQHPFGNTSSGEGLGFCLTGKVIPHNNMDLFTATIHGNNTASHKQLNIPEMVQLY